MTLRPSKTITWAALATMIAGSANAERVSRDLSYFEVRGSTPLEIEEQLVRNGPHSATSNRRHPGATRLEFSNRITYAKTDKDCRIAVSVVAITANVTLPRWQRPTQADRAARLYWAAVSTEIVRHEESHLVIARNHAREIERRQKALQPAKNCEDLSEAAKAIQQKVMTKHAAEQKRFDRVEGRALDGRLINRFKRRLAPD